MISKTWSCALVFFLALIGGAAAAEDGTATPQPAGNIIVPDGISATAVQQAIITAAVGRGWNVKEKTDSKVVLFLEQGGWRSTMTLAYTAREITLTSNSGKVGKNGVVAKPAIPEAWVRFLKLDIGKHLGLSPTGK